MRYFDRKLFVVQHVLVKHLPDEYNTKGYMNVSGQEQGNQNIERRALDELLQILNIIASDNYDMKSFLPERIQDIIKDGHIKDNEMHFVLSWIEQCGHRFSENIECWKSSINEILPGLSWNKYNRFKSADPNIFPAKVRILFDGSRIVNIVPDNNPWGEVIFGYPVADTEGIEPKQYEGWMMWAEIERFEGFYEFCFLFNTDGSEILSMESIMRDNNWIEFKIRCKHPNIKVRNYDYANHYNETGCQSTKIFLESCKALLAKANDIGTLYFNDKERALLYIAQLYECFSSAVNPEITDVNSVDVLKLQEFLSNQYGFEQTISIINETGDTELSEVLKNLRKNVSGEGSKKHVIECKKLINIMEDRDKSPQGRLFYKKLAKLMMDASSEYEKEWHGQGNFLKAKSAIVEKIEPFIINMGFTGEFPHYRRISKNTGEYITVFSVNHGCSCYLTNPDMHKDKYVRISMLAGNGPLTSDSSGFSLSGLPFEKSNAWDCAWDKKKCRSIYIGPSDDEGWFEFDCEDGGISSESDILKKAEEMIPYIEVANCSLKNKPLPEFYLKHHREQLKRNKTARKLMALIVISGLLFGLFLWVILNIVFSFVLNNGSKKGFDIDTLFVALGCGTLIGVIMGLYILYVIRRKVWPS